MSFYLFNNIKSSVKQKLVKRLNSAGFEKKKNLSPVDFSGLSISIAEVIERANYCPIVVDISLDRCRGLGMLAFPCTMHSAHPYIKTIREYRERTVTSYHDSALKQYYDCYQPPSAAEYLGIEDSNSHESFSRSPLQAIEPWGGVISRKEEERKLRVMREEGVANGVALKKQEWSFIGPISYERGEMEFKRLTRIADLIAFHGYIRDSQKDGDITGKLLCRGDHVSVLIGAGQHRISALGALGYSQAPVCIRPSKDTIIMREEVETWPGVTAGQFSVDQALSIFDRVFDGLQPHHYQECVSADR